MDTKLCTKCQTLKPITEFYTYKVRPHKNMCKECEKAESRRRGTTASFKQHIKDIYSTVINHYGAKCSCTGCIESNPAFLTLDHINNDGATHRKSLGLSSGVNFYRWVIANNFPSGLQTLCMNCNWGKNRNGGICPHEDTRNLRGEH